MSGSFEKKIIRPKIIHPKLILEKIKKNRTVWKGCDLDFLTKHTIKQKQYAQKGG